MPERRGLGRDAVGLQDAVSKCMGTAKEPRAKAIIAILSAPYIVGAAAMTALNGRPNAPWWAPVAIESGLLLLAIVALCVYWARADGHEPIWSRRVPRLPLTDDDNLTQLHDKLEDLRNAAVTWLTENTDERVQASQVRVNVFLPDCSDVRGGDACVLVIPPGLHAGMQGHTDVGIRLRPGQGATGRAFAEGKFVVALPNAAGDGVLPAWGPEWELTEAQQEMVHRDITWILSYPLRRSEREPPFGVTNIDALRLAADQPTVERLCASLAANLAAVASRLAERPQVRISVVREEC
jgi:hypothetical protein